MGRRSEAGQAAHLGVGNGVGRLVTAVLDVCSRRLCDQGSQGCILDQVLKLLGVIELHGIVSLSPLSACLQGSFPQLPLMLEPGSLDQLLVRFLQMATGTQEAVHAAAG